MKKRDLIPSMHVGVFKEPTSRLYGCMHLSNHKNHLLLEGFHFSSFAGKKGRSSLGESQAVCGCEDENVLAGQQPHALYLTNLDT